MENGGLKTTISEDSQTSEAPLCSLDVEVLPPPGEACKSKAAAGVKIAPIAVDEERVEKRQQSGVGWTCARHWSECQKRHLHGTEKDG